MNCKSALSLPSSSSSSSFSSSRRIRWYRLLAISLLRFECSHCFVHNHCGIQCKVFALTTNKFPLRQSTTINALERNLSNNSLNKNSSTRSNSKGRGRPNGPSQPDLRTQLDFARNGHCVLRQTISKERVEQLRKDLMTYARRQELLAWQQKVEVAANSPGCATDYRTVSDCKKALERLGVTPDELPFLQFFNTWRELSSVMDIVNYLGPIASALLDCESIRLYQDSLFWKRAGDGPTPWHTDGRMAPFDTSLLLTFWIPLQNIPRDGSALVFCSKSHSDFALPYWNEYSRTSDDPQSPWNNLDERYGGEAALVNYMPLEMGDITAHSGWVLHCADPPGAHDRVALAISLVDARAPVRGKLNRSSPEQQSRDGEDASHPEDAWSYRDWINQVPAGQPNFVHKLVPIVYPPKAAQQLRTAKRGVPKKKA